MDKKITLISVLTYLGFDMSSWDKKEAIELSDEHVAKMGVMQTEHKDLTAEVAQLKTDKKTADDALVTANAEKDKAETALNNALITSKAVSEALALKVEEGTTLSAFIVEIGAIAGAQPGAAEHSESVSDGDDMDEGEEARSKYAHNQAADATMGE